jgi:sugar O-acyltransferase (sialic acid O-acetyltransferase NeuD family)
MSERQHGAPRRLLILGTRSFASEVADLAGDLPDVEVAGFVENMDRDVAGTTLDGLPIYWIDDIAPLASTHLAVCALSTTHRRRFIAQAAALGMAFTTIVHPTARISRSAHIADGAIISAGAIVAAHARVGRHVIVNRGALIGHHTSLGDYVTAGPGANVGGCCTIAEATYLGIGAIVLDKLAVGRHAIVGAGAVVTKDVPARVQVMGVPARITKEGIDGR